VANPPAGNEGRASRIDIASIRREQVVEAAVAVITEQGLQNLSLSEIEKKAGMTRGHLTYYFPAKEDILLAVFDRLLQLMYQRIGTPKGFAGPCAEGATAWDWTAHLLEAILLRPPAAPAFGCLQYTFLSQMSHREDFRQRLAQLYEVWRGNMACGLAAEATAAGGEPAADPRLLTSLVQGLLHGLSMQLAVDPQAFDREAMFRLCHDLLAGYFRPKDVTPNTNNGKATPAPERPAPQAGGHARRVPKRERPS
jgi:AcrR family transcriptional regulator